MKNILLVRVMFAKYKKDKKLEVSWQKGENKKSDEKLILQQKAFSFLYSRLERQNYTCGEIAASSSNLGEVQDIP